MPGFFEFIANQGFSAQKIKMKNQSINWTIKTSFVSWFCAHDGDLPKNSKDRNLYRTKPIEFWRTHRPKHIDPKTAERFLNTLRDLTQKSPLKALTHKDLPLALNYFIESAFYWLLGEKSSFDEGIELLYKQDAVYWRETRKILDKARIRLSVVGPIFNQLKNLKVFEEQINRQKFNNSGWVLCLEAAKKLKKICGAIKEAQLDKPNSILPVRNENGAALKLRNIRRGQPPDQRLKITMELWAGVLEQTFGKTQHKFLAELLSAAVNTDFTPDAISHRLDSL